jgi:hypothetical protein
VIRRVWSFDIKSEYDRMSYDLSEPFSPSLGAVRVDGGRECVLDIGMSQTVPS